MSKNKTDRLRYLVLAVLTGIGIVQVIYAVGWAFLNGNNIQDFYDTAIYLQSAREFTSDGWRLAGYACILRLFQCLEGIIGDYYVIFLYVTQLICSLVSFAYGIKVIVRVIWNRAFSWKQALTVAVYLVTLPIVWQMQFAVLPDAFCLALLVLLFAQLLMLVFEHQKAHWERMWIAAGVCLLLGVMHHHYFYAACGLMSVSALILLVKQIFRRYRGKAGILSAISLLVILALTAFIREGVNDSVPKAEPYAEHTAATELWSRFVFPHLQEDYAFYPEEVKQVLPEDILPAGTEYYEFYLSKVALEIETSAEERASEVCTNMVVTSVSLHRNEAVKSFIKEGVAYGFIPMFMGKYMYENRGSLYGHNLMKMWEKAPGLTVDYMHISMTGFLIVCCMGSIMLLIEVVLGEKKLRHAVKAVVACGVGIVCVVLPMMLFAFEKFDYRIGLFSVFVWGATTVSLIMGQEWRKCNERKCNKEHNRDGAR